MAHAIRCFLRSRGRVLLVRPSGAGGDPGRWDAVSDRTADPPRSAESDGRRLLRAATGATDADLAFVRAGRPLDVDGTSGPATVHPVLFEGDAGDLAVGEAFDAAEWVDPTAIRARPTVPRLWEAWRRVAPTVETVRSDRTHGSAWIAARAAEVLRDAAATAEGWDDVAPIAADLRTARPEMAAVANAVDGAVAAAGPFPPDPDELAARAADTLEAALAAGTEAAHAAADRLRERNVAAVATLSRSGTVRAALSALSPARVVVAESRPEREGVGVAEWAADGTDAAVTLTTEAGLPTALAAADVDAVLVGADSIAPGGDVVNKTGTRILALAARDAGVPVYVAASTFKIRAAGGDGDDDAPEQASPADPIYDGDADVSVHAPAFEVVPARLVDGVATEEGVLDSDGIRAVAEARADDAAWAERRSA